MDNISFFSDLGGRNGSFPMSALLPQEEQVEPVATEPLVSALVGWVLEHAIPQKTLRNPASICKAIEETGCSITSSARSIICARTQYRRLIPPFMCATITPEDLGFKKGYVRIEKIYKHARRQGLCMCPIPMIAFLCRTYAQQDKNIWWRIAMDPVNNHILVLKHFEGRVHLDVVGISPSPGAWAVHSVWVFRRRPRLHT